MTEYVRVRSVTSGHEYTVTADRLARDPDAFIALDKDPLGVDRAPAEPKFRVPLGTPVAGSKPARKRAAKKAAAKKTTQSPPPPAPTDPVPPADPQTESTDGLPADTEQEK